MAEVIIPAQQTPDTAELGPSIEARFKELELSLINQSFDESFAGQLVSIQQNSRLLKNSNPALYNIMAVRALELGHLYEEVFPKGEHHKHVNALAVARTLIPLWVDGAFNQWRQGNIDPSVYESVLRWMDLGRFRDPSINMMSNIAKVYRTRALQAPTASERLGFLDRAKAMQSQANEWGATYGETNHLPILDESEAETERRLHLRPADLANNAAVYSLDWVMEHLMLKTFPEDITSVVEDRHLRNSVLDARDALKGSLKHVAEYRWPDYHSGAKSRITAQSNGIYMLCLDTHRHLISEKSSQVQLATNLRMLNNLYREVAHAIDTAPFPTQTAEDDIRINEKIPISEYLGPELKYRAAHILAILVIAEDSIPSLTWEVRKAKSNLIQTLVCRYYPKKQIVVMPNREQILDFGEELLDTALTKDADPEDEAECERYRRIYQKLRITPN